MHVPLLHHAPLDLPRLALRQDVEQDEHAREKGLQLRHDTHRLVVMHQRLLLRNQTLLFQGRLPPTRGWIQISSSSEPDRLVPRHQVSPEDDCRHAAQGQPSLLQLYSLRKQVQWICAIKGKHQGNLKPCVIRLEPEAETIVRFHEAKPSIHIPNW